jgi:hypothetical protein
MVIDGPIDAAGDTWTGVPDGPIYTWREEIDSFGFDGDKLPAIFHGLRGVMLTQIYYDKQQPLDEVKRPSHTQSFIMVANLASTVFNAYPELRWTDPVELQPKRFKIIR